MRAIAGKKSAKASNRAIEQPARARIRAFNLNIRQVTAFPQTLTTSHPVSIGDFVSIKSDFNSQPGGRFNLYHNGPQGAVVKVSLSWARNSGGHIHTGGLTGSVHPSSVKLGANYPQNALTVITAPETGGTLLIRSRFSKGSPSEFNQSMTVAVPGLMRFTGGAEITLTGSTSSHPDNHYGLARLNSAIRKLAKAFFKQFSKKIFVNDMSLVNGGLFDINADWAKPHKTHRDGRRVDINSTSMTTAEKSFFRTAAKEAGFRVVTLEVNPEHWHLEV
jgi:hypothetical protein